MSIPNKTKSHRTLIHKTYQQTEQDFQKVICNKISQRRCDIKVKEIYEGASVSRPTFYLHYENVMDARQIYEDKITNGLTNLLPTTVKREIFFEVLTTYIIRHQQYFLATQNSNDYYLLSQVFKQYRLTLVGTKVSDRAFCVYAGNLQLVIRCWLKFDNINSQTAAKTAETLKRVRIIEW